MDDLTEALVVEVCILAVQETFHLKNHLVVILPRNGFFIRGKRKKSLDAISGEYGGEAKFDSLKKQHMKKPLRGRHFQNDDEVIFEVECFLNNQNADFYNQGLHQVIHHWEKCVALKGKYVEKD
ncbi:hypothetical protein ANN_26492 [Periplaneta americana]|uniref:Uncharacterized protein n=1 Tax=Periplaneta americana TaxID=6978 RepID=A0ABQ8RYH0_PERAM|nr:hypothetical protein ANN_26492 [Periplaneta americana]